MEYSRGKGKTTKRCGKGVPFRKSANGGFSASLLVQQNIPIPLNEIYKDI